MGKITLTPLKKFLRGPEPQTLPHNSSLVREAKTEYLQRLAESGTLEALTSEATEALATWGISKIACIETLGIPLGTALALKFKVGLVLLRKADSKDLPSLPEEFLWEEIRDYTHRENSDAPKKYMYLTPGTIAPGDRVLLVDDKIDTGGQFEAAYKLVQRATGDVVGGISEGISKGVEETTKVEKLGFELETSETSSLVFLVRKL